MPPNNPLQPQNPVQPPVPPQLGVNPPPQPQIPQQPAVPVTPQPIPPLPPQPVVNPVQQVPVNVAVASPAPVVMPPQTPIVQQPAMNPQAPQNIAPVALPHLPSKAATLITIISVISISIGINYFTYHVLAVRKENAAKHTELYQPAKKAKEEQKKVGEEVIDRSDSTLDLQTTFDNQYSAYDQDITAKIGQQVNMANGLSFMVTKVEPWVPKSKYTKPKAGYKFVQIHLVVGNRNSKRLASYNGSFSIKEGEAQPRTDGSVYLSSEDGFTGINYAKYGDGIDTSKSIEASLFMEVKDSGPVYLVYKDNKSGYPKDSKDDDYKTQQMNMSAEVTLQ